MESWNSHVCFLHVYQLFLSKNNVNKGITTLKNDQMWEHGNLTIIVYFYLLPNAIGHFAALVISYSRMNDP